MEKDKYKNEATKVDSKDETKRIKNNLQDNEPQDKIPEKVDINNGISNPDDTKANGKTEPNKIENDGSEKDKEQGEKKVEGRGRHFKDCACEKCEAKRVSKNEEPIIKTEDKKIEVKDPLDLSSYTKKNLPSPKTEAQKSNHVDLTQFISGALFLIAIDAVMPSIILTLFGWFNKKYKGVDAKLLRLTADESKKMEPLAEAMVKLLFGSANPIVAFAVTMGLIYAGKFMMLQETDFKPIIEKGKGKK